MATELIKAAREVPAASPAGINAKAVRGCCAKRVTLTYQNPRPPCSSGTACRCRAASAGFDAVPSAGMMNTALFGANGLRRKTKSSEHGQGQRSRHHHACTPSQRERTGSAHPSAEESARLKGCH